MQPWSDAQNKMFSSPAQKNCCWGPATRRRSTETLILPKVESTSGCCLTVGLASLKAGSFQVEEAKCCCLRASTICSKAEEWAEVGCFASYWAERLSKPRCCSTSCRTEVFHKTVVASSSLWLNMNCPKMKWLNETSIARRASMSQPCQPTQKPNRIRISMTRNSQNHLNQSGAMRWSQSELVIVKPLNPGPQTDFSMSSCLRALGGFEQRWLAESSKREKCDFVVPNSHSVNETSQNTWMLLLKLTDFLAKNGHLILTFRSKNLRHGVEDWWDRKE